MQNCGTTIRRNHPWRNRLSNVKLNNVNRAAPDQNYWLI